MIRLRWGKAETMPDDITTFGERHLAGCMVLTRDLLQDLIPAKKGGDILMSMVHRLQQAGVPVSRINLSQMTIHPLVRGYDYDWWEDEGYGERTFDSLAGGGEQPVDMMQFPFYAMYEWGKDTLHVDLTDPGDIYFPIFDRLRAAGATDYYARIVYFPGEDRELPLSNFNMSFATRRVGGFTESDMGMIDQALLTVMPTMRFLMLNQVTENLAGVYLGEDAGHRVLAGEIDRGSLRTVRAAILYADMQGSTKVADNGSAREYVDFLNAYLEGAVEAVHEAGGQVLKFMGDGVLAVFTLPEACAGIGTSPMDGQVASQALMAAFQMQAYTKTRNEERAREGLPITSFSTAIHLGDVMYGNIGGRDRLDFTVVGPAVNEASRLLAMARPLDRNIIVSQEVAQSVHKPDMLFSMGRYMLRGVSRPRELFTLDENAAAKACAAKRAAEGR